MAPLHASRLRALELVARAESKDVVQRLLADAFALWIDRAPSWTKARRQQCVEELDLQAADETGKGADGLADSLHDALTALIAAVVGAGESAADVLPSDGTFHADLRKLLVKQVEKALPAWRESAASSAVGPPRVTDIKVTTQLVDAGKNANIVTESATPARTPIGVPLPPRPAVAGPEYEVTLRVNMADGNDDIFCRVEKPMLDELVQQLHVIKEHVASLPT